MKLSIIIPVYNVENHIKQLLNMIVKQYCKGIEVILVDDGSTDDSFKICKKYSEMYNFIKVTFQKNSGVSSARNTALDKASGSYVVFLDSDDEITDTYISDILELCDLDKDIVQMNWFSGNPIEGYKLATVDLPEGDSISEEYVRCLVQQKSNAPWNKIYRRNIIERYKLRFDTSMTVGEDINFTIQFIQHAQTIYVSKKAAYKYFINPNGLCGNINLSFFYDNYKLNKNIIKMLDTEGYSEGLYHELANSMLRTVFRTIGHCIKKGYSKNEIQEAIMKSGIKNILRNVKCVELQDFIRLSLIKVKAYYLIGIITKNRC